MRLLKDILYRVHIENVVGNTNVALESISNDSRKVANFSACLLYTSDAADE